MRDIAAAVVLPALLLLSSQAKSQTDGKAIAECKQYLQTPLPAEGSSTPASKEWPNNIVAVSLVGLSDPWPYSAYDSGQAQTIPAPRNIVQQIE
jgi:hypothetical protein